VRAQGMLYLLRRSNVPCSMTLANAGDQISLRGRDAHHVFGQVRVEGKARHDGLELSKSAVASRIKLKVRSCLGHSWA